MFQRIVHSFKSCVGVFFWLVTMRRWGVRDVFNNVYRGQSRSETFREILREVLGDEYAEEADPTGFLSMTDLKNLAHYVAVGKDDTFADVACGRGGAGLWVARETGARLVGIDISEVAVEEARKRIAHFGLEGRAHFQFGDFAATRCASESFDGVISVDALYLVADKTGSIEEMARILRPGARFVCTTWELDERFHVSDYRPLMEKAGFEVEHYEMTPDWEERQRGVHERVLARQEELTHEMGEEAARFWILGAKIELPLLAKMRRVLAVGRKR
jgi:SAM-dependent methyltransferase